jgi:MFS transporter, DHA1 family, inner membrane transport protein
VGTQANFQSARTIALTLAIGSGGTLMLGVQPVLLEALVSQGRLSVTQVGWVATAEVLGMACGVLLGTRTLGGRAARSIAVAAGLCMALANLCNMFAGQANLILAIRSLSGLAEGVLVAIVVLSISYSTAPTRLNAAFLTVAAVPQLLFAYLIPAMLAPRVALDFGFVLLGGVGLLCALLAVCIRERFTPGDFQPLQRIAWTPPVALALFATLMTAAAIGACWGYAGPMAAELGLSAGQVGVAVAVSLICQLLGSLVVAVVGWRLSFRTALLCGCLLQAATVMCLLGAHHALEFTLALGVFGCLWSAGMSFAMDLIVAVDSSRTTAPLILPLSLAGLSIGPFIASCFVDHSVAAAFRVSLVGFAVALLAYLCVFRSRATIQLSPGQGPA